MAETIDVRRHLTFTVESVSGGISLVVREHDSSFGWVLSPIIASRLAEALIDALTIRELKKRR
jgi:hypothetical protein